MEGERQTDAMGVPTRVWRPLAHFQEHLDYRYALIVLSNPARGIKSWFNELWTKASFTSCVDGGANALYDHNVGTNSIKLMPDLVSGDFDSIRPDVREFYQRSGVEVIETPDQNETDFTKNLRLVASRLQKLDGRVSSCVTTSGLDHAHADHCFAHHSYTSLSLPPFAAAMDRTLHHLPRWENRSSLVPACQAL
ncbi:PREDICTED: thiamin pyrophosphokinase 1-like [Priapulus caudatus]|uniref:Thiamin pyrophosphokinase 1-like n=1 Tax=Priapulus caudatus TaxID=37621 RepID=A0ABM1EYN3_PRICU|nr:PREDICTED: thiamin pyrophosphokinase 1-like [Priapulus caudatus]